MKTADVKKLKPVERFLYFIKEREKVRVLKEGGYPKPWTDDEILQQYRFCNVRRMDDKVSRWLKEWWYQPHYNHPNMLVACVIARHFNVIHVFDAITSYVFGTSRMDTKYRPAEALAAIQKIKARGQTVFNGAYMIHADKSADKSEMVINRVVQPFYDKPPALDYTSMERCVEKLTTFWNIGSFMAGQIVADLRWATHGGYDNNPVRREDAWADRKTWAPIGPGSKRGMNRLLERDLAASLSQEEFTTHLSALMVECKAKLPKEIHSRLEAMDYQNCLCETDKLNRVLNGEGKPKQRYPGRE